MYIIYIYICLSFTYTYCRYMLAGIMYLYSFWSLVRHLRSSKWINLNHLFVVIVLFGCCFVAVAVASFDKWVFHAPNLPFYAKLWWVAVGNVWALAEYFYTWMALHCSLCKYIFIYIYINICLYKKLLHKYLMRYVGSSDKQEKDFCVTLKLGSSLVNWVLNAGLAYWSSLPLSCQFNASPIND